MAPPNKLRLPLSKVRTIMKSSPDCDEVAMEPLILVTKLTELFIADLAKRALGSNASLEYHHIANLVKEDDVLDFLRQIIPCKITVGEYKRLMAIKKSERSESSSEGEEEQN